MGLQPVLHKRGALLGTVVLGAITLLLAACASPGARTPGAALLDPGTIHAERSLAGAALTDAAWPARDWWTELGDPELDALINEALERNPEIAIASARARQAQAQAGLANAQRGPGVKASASLSGAHLPSTLLPAPLGGHFGWIKYGTLNFNWDLDLWGGKRATWEAAVDQAHAALIDAQATRLLVSVNVARTYARLEHAVHQQRLANDELARARDAHRLTAERVDAGIDSRLLLKRAEAEVAMARAQRAEAARQVDATRIALATLLGRGPDRTLDIKATEPLLPARFGVPAELPAALLGRRPDLVAARWRVEAAGHDVAAARARFLPDVSLGALAGLVAKGGDTLFQLPARFYQFAPAISLPVFDGGRLRAGLAGHEAAYDLAVAAYNKALVGAVNQVAGEVRSLDRLAEQALAQQQALDAAREAWQLSRQRYAAGVGSFLEALDVRQQLLAAEQAQAAVRARQTDLSIQLIQALGGGFQATGEAAPQHLVDHGGPSFGPPPSGASGNAHD